jgi:hypothetical protein
MHDTIVCLERLEIHRGTKTRRPNQRGHKPIRGKKRVSGRRQTRVQSSSSSGSLQSQNTSTVHAIALKDLSESIFLQLL